jgi:hypothetical protein
MRHDREIKYNDSAQALRLEYPSHWRAETITACTVAISTTGAGELLAATAATCYTATTLGAAATLGAVTITLTGTAGNLATGDRIRLVSPYEDVTVKSYNSTSKVATLERALLADHANGTAVHGLWCTYSLSTATVATWTLGLECVCKWTPNSDDLPLTELSIVEGVGFGAKAYKERFAAIYPSEYEVAQARIEMIYEEARSRINYRLQGKNLNIDRVVDQEILMPVLLDMMRFLVVNSGGNAWATERESAWATFLASEDVLTSQPIWADDNQDGAEAEAEVTTHEPWRRARGL